MVLPKEVRSDHDVWWLQVFDNCGMFNLCTHSSSTCLCLVQHSVSPSFDPTVHPLLKRDQQSTVLNSTAILLVLVLFITFQTYPSYTSYYSVMINLFLYCIFEFLTCSYFSVCHPLLKSTASIWIHLISFREAFALKYELLPNIFAQYVRY